jgi:hypothetical protein
MNDDGKDIGVLSDACLRDLAWDGDDLVLCFEPASFDPDRSSYTLKFTEIAQFDVELNWRDRLVDPPLVWEAGEDDEAGKCRVVVDFGGAPDGGFSVLARGRTLTREDRLRAVDEAEDVHRFASTKPDQGNNLAALVGAQLNSVHWRDLDVVLRFAVRSDSAGDVVTHYSLVLRECSEAGIRQRVPGMPKVRAISVLDDAAGYRLEVAFDESQPDGIRMAPRSWSLVAT